MPRTVEIIQAYLNNKRRAVFDHDAEMLLHLGREADSHQFWMRTVHTNEYVRAIQDTCKDMSTLYTKLMRFRAFMQELECFPFFAEEGMKELDKIGDVPPQQIEAWHEQWRTGTKKKLTAARERFSAQMAAAVKTFQDDTAHEKFLKLALPQIAMQYRHLFVEGYGIDTRFDVSFEDVAACTRGKLVSNYLRHGVILGYAMLCRAKLSEEVAEETEMTPSELCDEIGIQVAATGDDELTVKKMAEITEASEAKMRRVVSRLVYRRKLEGRIEELRLECEDDEQWLAEHTKRD